MLHSDEAVLKIPSNSKICLPAGIAAPPGLLESMASQYEKFNNISFYQSIGLLPHRYFMEEKMAGHFLKESTYNAGPDRMAQKIAPMCISPSSVHLSESNLFFTKWNHMNVHLGTCSAMNKWGYVSLGTSVIYERDVLDDCDLVILEMNENIPFSYGDTVVHISQVDYFSQNNRSIVEIPSPPPSDKDKTIAGYISDLVPDGATIQLGVGGVPNAVAALLAEKKDLGVHTELLVDSYIDLWEAGAVTNKKKNVGKGKMTACLAFGSNKLYNFMDHNPVVEMRRGSYTNSIETTSTIDNLISINMTMQTDLYGACASESLGTEQYSGTGGQLDWVRGAKASKGGKSIICFYSTAKEDTISKIVPIIKDGSAITTPRSDIDYVVTEYGVAHLRGKNFSDRAKLMINIAHPKFRAYLEEEAKKLKILR